MKNNSLREDWSEYRNCSVLSFDLYKDYRDWKQSKKQTCSPKCTGCNECDNMIQMDRWGFICGALEVEETGESFYVIKDGEKTIDYYSCDGEYYVQKPRPLKPVLKRV